MKKRLLALSTLALLTMTSCGQTSDSAASTKTDSPASVEPVPSVDDGSKTHIQFWSTIGQNNRAAFETIVHDFEAEYPDYVVDLDYKSGSYNDLKEMVEKGFAAGAYPDVVQCYPDHVAEYLDYGKAVNLDKFINSTNPEVGLSADDKADYIKAFWDEGTSYTIEGTYSVPFCKSTELMFYNEDVLVNLPLSSVDPTINGGHPLSADYLDNLTWEELFGKLAPAIVRYNETLPDNSKILKSDKSYHSVFGYDSDDNLFITLAQQYGYGYTSIDKTTGKGHADFVNDQAKSTMKVFDQAAEKGYIMSKGSAGGKFVNEFFTANNCLFSVGSTGGVKYQFSAENPMNVGVARIPHAQGHDPKTISQGPSLTILDHGDEKRQLGSWLFYKFLTNKDNALDWALDSGYMPIRLSAYATEDYEDAFNVKNKADKSLEKLMARVGSYVENMVNETFTSPAFKGSSACRNAAAGIMTGVLTKGLLDDAALNKLFDDNYQEAVKQM